MSAQSPFGFFVQLLHSGSGFCLGSPLVSHRKVRQCAVPYRVASDQGVGWARLIHGFTEEQPSAKSNTHSSTRLFYHCIMMDRFAQLPSCLMNITAKTLTLGLGIALVACGTPAASDVAETVHAIDIQAVKKKAQEEGEAQVAEAHAAARREINQAVLKHSLMQAKLDYRTAIAKADHDLSIALDQCAIQATSTRSACAIKAHSARDHLAETARVSLSQADQ